MILSNLSVSSSCHRNSQATNAMLNSILNIQLHKEWCMCVCVSCVWCAFVYTMLHKSSWHMYVYHIWITSLTDPAVLVSAVNLPCCITLGIKVTSDEFTSPPSNFPLHNWDTSLMPVRCWGRNPGFSLPARIFVMWMGLQSTQLRATAFLSICPP